MPLQPPPRDANGEVIPHDHVGILDSDGVIRRISRHHVVEDEKSPDGQRVSSMAFKPSSGLNGGLSVDLQAQIEEAELDVCAFVISPPFIGAVRFQARQLRTLNLIVGFEPMPDNPYHGEVWGNFSRATQRSLQNQFEWFVPVSGLNPGK